MKRPGGFDRTPDQPRPEPEPPAGRPPAEVSEATGRPGPRLSRVPARAHVPETGVSPTIDLSDVRASRHAPPEQEAPDSATRAEEDLQGRASGAIDGARAVRLSDEHPTVDLGSLDTRARSGLDRFRGSEPDPVREAERRVAAAARLRKRQARRERRRFSAEARGRRRHWIIAFAAVGALALFVGAGVFTPLMAVKTVEVTGAESVNAADVHSALERFEGRPLALIDDAEVHRALEPFPLIQRYAVERVPPHTLVVRIEERVPVISVAGTDGVELYDAAGVLLGAADAAPAGVPVGAGALTDRGSAAFRSASRALRDMPADLRAQITSASASSAQDVTFTLASGITVLWGDADESRRKAMVLQAMLASLAGQPVTRIDVSATEAPVFE